MPTDRDFLAALAIVLLVALTPLIGGWWPGISAFGFPFGAFMPLLAGPVLMIVVMSARRVGEGEDDGSGETFEGPET